MKWLECEMRDETLAEIGRISTLESFDEKRAAFTQLRARLSDSEYDEVRMLLLKRKNRARNKLLMMLHELKYDIKSDYTYKN